MPEISESIRCFAEEPDRMVVEPLPPLRRIQREAFTVILSPMPTMSNVSGVRTTERELDATIAEARGVVRGAGYTRTVWNVGPSSRPANLATLLAERGFVPATQPPFEPQVTAMALIHPPPAAPAEVETRAVRTFEEYLEAWYIAIEAFNESEEDAAGWLAAAPALWAQQDGVERLSYLAFLEGIPVGFAFALAGAADGLLLGGSGVRVAARGKGVYRALLAGRWDDAVRLGRPALVIQAGAMSRPILERCGFETICRLTIWEDPAISAPSR
ncbi:MAG TPA: hypothetical protein VGP07_25405 [Polyangia bacterium]|jgi:hypothetical protein